MISLLLWLPATTLEFILEQSEVSCKIMDSGQWLGWVLIARACFRKIYQFIICSWLIIFMRLSPWAAYVHIVAPLANICRVCGGAFIMWVPVVLSVPDVCKDCCVQIHPKEQSSYEVFWKFYCKFAMLVSVFWQMVLGCCTVEVAYGISKNLPCLLFLIEALNLSGLCNCFLKQLTRECQGTNFLTCNDLWCHKFSDPVSPSTEVCKWR